jgi:phosphoglycerate dehydrogenase-like enzyme
MVRVAVSGIPRGYQFPRPDGNWLKPEHINRIKAVHPSIELVELPADEVHDHPEAAAGFDCVLAEGGNRVHYAGELDWEDYQRFFTLQLKWVQLCSTGFSDNITPEVLDRSVTLTNSPGIHTVPISESILAAILDYAKLLKQRRVDQGTRTWRQLKCSDLEGSTVLFVGLGNIGGRAARLCKAFGMRVIGTKRSQGDVPGVDHVFPPEQIKRHIREADYVVITAPLTPETEGLISREVIASMKPTSYLINVGRGLITDEDALAEALREKRIGGAYLDCFGVEPLPPDHPFWGLENVLFVPHDSHSSPGIGDRLVDQFCVNLRRFIAGDPLLNICDPHRGY